MASAVSVPREGVPFIAHRGLSGAETENTCAAFVAAGHHRYFGIETDVWITADNQFVLIHDKNPLRVSGTDTDVTQSTLSQLQTIRLYDGSDKETRSDLVIPVLADYLRICKRYQKKAVLELKDAMTREQVYSVVGECERFGYLRDVIFISFSWENLLFLREKEPNQPAQFLTASPCDDALIDRLAAEKFDLDILWSQISAETVEKLHARGILVNSWTVDDPDIARKLIADKVDFITTNILE